MFSLRDIDNILIPLNRRMVREALPSKYWVIETVDDVEPVLHGPYTTRERRDIKARALRRKQDEPAGLYMLDFEKGRLRIGAYSGWFFERCLKCDGYIETHTLDANNHAFLGEDDRYFQCSCGQIVNAKEATAHANHGK